MSYHISIIDQLAPMPGALIPGLKPDGTGRIVSPKAPSTESNSPQNALTLLDALLNNSSGKRVGKNQVLLILDALASAADKALVERFPAVLAVCARSGIDVDGQALLARYWESSPKRQNLEKLLLISVALFEHLKLTPPGNLRRVAIGLKRKYPPLTIAGDMQLSTGVTVSMQGLHQTLSRFGLLTIPAVETPSTREIVITSEVKNLLNRLFSPKQKELVLKKLNNQPMTKTEREYYSRTSKKKLGAILNETVQEIARRLAQ